MKTVAVEDLMLDVIISFCENAAELGCPQKKEVDMWIREMPPKNAQKVMEKLLEIMERDNLPLKNVKTTKTKEKSNEVFKRKGG